MSISKDFSFLTSATSITSSVSAASFLFLLMFAPAPGKTHNKTWLHYLFPHIYVCFCLCVHASVKHTLHFVAFVLIDYDDQGKCHYEQHRGHNENHRVKECCSWEEKQNREKINAS